MIQIRKSSFVDIYFSEDDKQKADMIILRYQKRGYSVESSYTEGGVGDELCTQLLSSRITYESKEA